MRLSIGPESDRRAQKGSGGRGCVSILTFHDKGRKLWAQAFVDLVVTFRPFESRSVLLNKAWQCY